MFEDEYRPPIIIEETCLKWSRSPKPKVLGIEKDSKEDKYHIFVLVHGLAGSNADLNWYA